MSLSECKKEHTHREYLAWQAWLDGEQDRPDSTQHYLMQIAMEVRRVLSKNPNSIKLNDFKLSFKRKGEKTTGSLGYTKEQATAWAKARWMGLTGLLKNVKKRD